MIKKTIYPLPEKSKRKMIRKSTKLNNVYWKENVKPLSCNNIKLKVDEWDFYKFLNLKNTINGFMYLV